MQVDLVISAFRTMLLNYRNAHHGSTRLPAGMSIVGAEVAQSYPCIQIQPNGGEGSVNFGMHVCDLQVTVWGQGAWDELMGIMAEVDRACNRKSGTEVVSPILYCVATASPTQAGVGALKGWRAPYHIIARETP